MRIGIVTFAAGLLLSFAGLSGPVDAAPRDKGLKLPTYRLFDLGVADPDRDGRLDLFTTNHKFQAALLRNRGEWRFRDRLARWGLSQDPAFPGLDALASPRKMSAPGAYLWLTDRPGEPGEIHLAAVGRPVRVQITVRSVAVATAFGAATATIVDGPDSTQRIAVWIDAGASVEIAVSALGELPVGFDFGGNDGLAADEIRVGADGDTPPAHRFEIQLHDRHGLAFSDVNGDGVLDPFIVSGGAGGKIEDPRINSLVSDQLMLSDDRRRGIRYRDRTRGSGIVKGACRGREATWVDYDGDGVLDLFVTCENRAPLMFRGLGDGKFERATPPPFNARTFRWIELGGSRPSLVAGAEGGLEVWRYGEGGWELLQSLPSGRLASRIIAGDLQNDGRLDVLALVGRKVRAYRNTPTGLRELGRGRLGLPGGEVGIALVDADNDGRLDLSTARSGLLLWDRGRGRFARTGELVRKRAGYAILNWPDLDNDGRRDLVAAYSGRQFSAQSSIVVRRGRGRVGRWLQVDLRGAPGNPEAIGARVTVEPLGGRTAGHRGITQYVGQNEGSRHSQGHYRTYFGLGGAERAKLTVVWPDGERITLRVRTNRLLTITK